MIHIELKSEQEIVMINNMKYYIGLKDGKITNLFNITDLYPDSKEPTAEEVKRWTDAQFAMFNGVRSTE